MALSNAKRKRNNFENLPNEDQTDVMGFFALPHEYSLPGTLRQREKMTDSVISLQPIPTDENVESFRFRLPFALE